MATPVELFENYLARFLVGEDSSIGITEASRHTAERVLKEAHMTPQILAGLVADIASDEALDLDAALETCANQVYAAVEKLGNTT